MIRSIRKMPSLKIYPPTRLPNDDVTETQFSMWKEEMEVYLSQEPDFKIFLPSKGYGEWTCYEENPLRIPSLKNEGLQRHMMYRKEEPFQHRKQTLSMKKSWKLFVPT